MAAQPLVHSVGVALPSGPPPAPPPSSGGQPRPPGSSHGDSSSNSWGSIGRLQSLGCPPVSHIHPPATNFCATTPRVLPQTPHRWPVGSHRTWPTGRSRAPPPPRPHCSHLTREEERAFLSMSSRPRVACPPPRHATPPSFGPCPRGPKAISPSPEALGRCSFQPHCCLGYSAPESRSAPVSPPQRGSSQLLSDMVPHCTVFRAYFFMALGRS